MCLLKGFYMHQDVIFREYDIRGVFEKDFDSNFAFSLGFAFVQYMKEISSTKTLSISIGHDARVSSPVLVAELSRGMRTAGANVTLLGLVTTPMCYFSTFEVPGIDGSIMVTGSHNPPDYNGFKISAGKYTIFGEEIQKLKRIINSQKSDTNNADRALGSEKSFDLKPMYLKRYAKEFGKLNPVKIVLDCGNGAAGAVVRELFHAVGLAPTILFEKPDGTFPNHHPDPTVEKNLKQLAEQVLKEGAVCGIGFDGDADRIGIVDHTGKMIYGDELMVIYARAILALQTGQKIIGDVKCSDRMYADISKHGGLPIMWKTGHSLIKEKVKVEKAPFGGEMSGHIFFQDRNYGYDDAPYAALRLVEILSQTQKNIPELLTGLPPSFNTPEIRVDTTEEKKVLIVEKMKAAFPMIETADYKVNLTDGIRLSFNHGWALCRSSNTQPVLVLRYESNSLAGLEEIQKRVSSIVDKYL
jgi:phosphomannomutase/phosphoglucomutase